MYAFTKYIFLLLLAAGSVCAQNPRTDSLENLLKKQLPDSEKIKTLNRLGAIYLNSGDYEKVFAYETEAIQLGEKANYPNGLAMAYNIVGNVYNNQGNFPRALDQYFKSLHIQEKINNKKGIAALYNNIGNVYRGRREDANALEYYRKSIKLKEEINDQKGLAYTYNNLGISYENMQNFTLALDCYFKSIKIWKMLGIESENSAVYDNAGNVYAQINKFDSAIYFHKIAIGQREKDNDVPGMASSYLNTGIVYNMAGDRKKALDFMQKALALSKELGAVDLLADTEESLTEFYESMRDHKNALLHYKAFIAYRDSIFNEENTRKTVQSQMQYDFDKKEAAAKLEQEKKEAVAQAESRRQRIILFSISGFGLLVLAFAIFAWRSFLQKKKANIEISHQKEIIEEKQKEILDSIYYARRIQRSLLPSEKYITRVLLKKQER